jgi:hypothetical protein
MIGTTTIWRIDLNPERAESLFQLPSPDWSRGKISLRDLGTSAVKLIPPLPFKKKEKFPLFGKEGLGEIF